MVTITDARRRDARRRDAHLLISAATLAVLAAACTAAPSGGSVAHSPSPSPAPTPTATPTPEDRLRVDTGDWPRTDFTRHTVPLGEFLSGGPRRDGIPPIDRPSFESVEAAGGWLSEEAPVILLTLGGETRAYPLAILLWHEIVNDTVGGVPVVVTFCPLCNTSLVFERTLEGTVHDFGTTGNLRFSDLVMYDRQTESWWQQATGEAVVGELAGTMLTFVPSQVIALGTFAAEHPDGAVLSRDTGHPRDYGKNPYVGYDRADEQPFLYDGVVDGRVAPKERIVTVAVGDDAVAFPYSELAKAGVAQTTVGGTEVAVFWVPGTASPLDQVDAEGRDIGATGVFRPIAGGRALTFRRGGDTGVAGASILDAETGSTWSVTGLATSGPLAGTRLEPVVHGDHFWFAWAAFEPATRIWTAP